MTNKIVLKRSAVAGKVPLTSSLDLGELAVNTVDGALYMKKNVGGIESIVRIGGSNISFYCFTTTSLSNSNNWHGNHWVWGNDDWEDVGNNRFRYRAQIFSPPVTIKALTFYVTGGRPANNDNNDTVFELWLNDTTLLGSVTLYGNVRISPKVNLGNVTVTTGDFLSIAALGDWDSGISCFVTW